MKYLCLVCFEGKILEAMSKEEHVELDRACLAYNAELERTGHLVMAQALQSPDTAKTVRVRHGQLATTDGPFAETKEQIGGFVLIDARDFDEAIALAAKLPIARFGSIEVRPIYDIPEPPPR